MMVILIMVMVVIRHVNEKLELMKDVLIQAY